MNRKNHVSRGAWILVAVSALVCAGSIALPRVHPVPRGTEPELTALRIERDSLLGNNDGALAALREKVKVQPPVTWSVEEFTTRIGTGWRVDWQTPAGGSRRVLLTRSAPRLREWSEYQRFLRTWAAQPGVAFEALEVNARGSGPSREITTLAIGLRLLLRDEPTGAKPVGPDPPGKSPLAVRSLQSNPPTQIP